MSGVSPSRPFRENILVGVLCLLAFFFAVEAKLALYVPMNGTGCDIRAAKACPADTPRVVAHGISSPDSAHRLSSFALQFACAEAFTNQTIRLRGRDFEDNPQQAQLVASSSNNVFVRPPPTL